MKQQLLGCAILVGFELLGAGLHRLGAPLPGAVLGLLLFVLALALGLVRLVWVERAATLAVRHMTLLFVPIMAALPGLSPELRRNAAALAASTVISLLAVLLTTGGLAHWLLRETPPASPGDEAGS
jgi:holin-like protein